jgi:hypothetical protein
VAEQDENAVIWYRKTIEFLNAEKKHPLLPGRRFWGLVQLQTARDSIRTRSAT